MTHKITKIVSKVIQFYDSNIANINHCMNYSKEIIIHRVSVIAKNDILFILSNALAHLFDNLINIGINSQQMYLTLGKSDIIKDLNSIFIGNFQVL